MIFKSINKHENEKKEKRKNSKCKLMCNSDVNKQTLNYAGEPYWPKHNGHLLSTLSFR